MSKNRLTEDMLRQIMPYSTVANRRAAIVPLNDTAAAYKITTQKRMAAWLATIAIESGSLKYQEEIASGAAYEGRRDLGNTQPGDGRRFKGHGRIQITGRANHQAYTNYLKTHNHLPFVDFIVNPKKLAQEPYATDAAGWFVAVYKKGLQAADRGDFLAYSKLVNGVNKRTGLPNHWNERNAVYQRALRVLTKDFLLNLGATEEPVEEEEPNIVEEQTVTEQTVVEESTTMEQQEEVAVETSETEVTKTEDGTIATTVQQKNEQDVNVPATVAGPKIYNEIGFIPTIRRDLAAVGLGNFGFEGLQTLLQQATGIPEWAVGLLVKAGVVILVVSIIYIIFRVIHYCVFKLSDTRRLVVETTTKTDVTKKDVEYV